MSAFEQLLVVETAQHVAGPYCGKLLADHGARVVKVEPPATGDVARAARPTFLHLNTNKQSVAVDLDSDVVRRLCLRADVLIDDGTLTAAGVSYDELAEARPDLVITTITGFGSAGPYASFRMNDFVAYASSAWMAAMGDPGKPPLYPGVDYPFYVAAIYAAFGTCAALRQARRQGRAPHVSVSVLDAAISIDFYETSKYTFHGRLRQRDGHMITGVAASVQPCGDGYVALTFSGEVDWGAFCEVIGAPELAEGRFSTAAARLANAEELNERLQAVLARHAVDDVVRECQARHVAVSRVASTADVYASAQLRARRWFRELPDGLEYPGPPFRLQSPAWRLARPAPRLGEHTEAVLAELDRDGARPTRRAAGGDDVGPFAGIRIVDLTMGWAGPACTLQLADLGAEVIKIEGPGRLDWWRGGSVSQPNPDMSDVNDRTWERSAVFSGVNRNKRSLVLDMKHDRGREVFARLVAASDVVVESFSPGVVERWGFGYERLRELNERIILLSLPAAGSDGPWSHYVGYASTTEALAGLPALCGYAGGSPILQTPSIADPVAGLNGAAALAMALYEREVTGRGQAIEVAHLEAMTPLVGEALIDHALTGAIRERSGTGDTSYAPNGCYRCAGDDRWVVISAREDAEWQALAAAVGRPELADDPRFRRRTDRVANRAVVDEVVEAWTRTQDRRAAMETLQRAGVLAGAVNNEADLLDDPQVQAAGSFVDIDREHVGVHPYPNATLRLDGRRAPVRRPAPLFGEDNRHVLRSILGLDDEEIEQLYADEVVADVPTAAGRARLSSFSGTLTRHTTDVS